MGGKHRGRRVRKPRAAGAAEQVPATPATAVKDEGVVVGVPAAMDHNVPETNSDVSGTDQCALCLGDVPAVVVSAVCRFCTKRTADHQCPWVVCLPCLANYGDNVCIVCDTPLAFVPGHGGRVDDPRVFSLPSPPPLHIRNPHHGLAFGFGQGGVAGNVLRQIVWVQNMLDIAWVVVITAIMCFAVVAMCKHCQYRGDAWETFKAASSKIVVDLGLFIVQLHRVA